MQQKIARLISIAFHPVLVPTLGFLLLFNSGFYFSMLSGEAKRFVLLVVFFSTCILPLLTIAVLAFNSKFDVTMPKSRDRIIPLLATSVYYYLGFILMNRIRIFTEFKLFLLGSVLVIVLLLLVSFKWKISNHSASIGGLAGAVFALSFRNGFNPLYSILIVVLLSGAVATARLLLNKHDIWQIVAGYVLGFSILYSAIYFS